MTISVDNAPGAIAQLVLAHGAGADKDSDFMQQMAAMLAERGIKVIRFNFPYMEKAKLTGKKAPPDRSPKLLDSYRSVIAKLDKTLPLFIGGKSMGGRMATLLLDESEARGGVCYGYPFHPPGKPEKLRTEHLENLSTPLLVAQGERDTFGKREEIIEYNLSDSISVKYLSDGDHSLKPRKASGLTLEQNMQTAADETLSFIESTLNEAAS